MIDIGTKIDNDPSSAGKLTAVEFNHIPTEIENAIKPFMALDENDDNQLAKAIVAVGGHTEKTIATFRAMTDTPKKVYVTGYNAENDGAFGSLFFKKIDSGVDNGVTIFETQNAVYELQHNGVLDTRNAGVVGDGSDETLAVQKAIDVSVTLGLEVQNTTKVKVKDLLLRDYLKLNCIEPFENYDNTSTVVHYCGSYMENKSIKISCSDNYAGNALAFDDTYTPSKDYAGGGVGNSTTQYLELYKSGTTATTIPTVGRGFYINCNNNQGLSFNIFKSGKIQGFFTGFETETTDASYFNSNKLEVTFKSCVNFMFLGFAGSNQFDCDFQEMRDVTVKGIFCSELAEHNRFKGKNWDWAKNTAIADFAIFDLGDGNYYDGLEQNDVDFQRLVYLGERRANYIINPPKGAEVNMDKVVFPLAYSVGGTGRQDNVLGYADKMMDISYSHSPWEPWKMFNQENGYTPFTSSTNFDDDELVITIDTGSSRIANYVGIEFLNEYVCTYIKIEYSNDDSATPASDSWAIAEDNQGFNINTLYAMERTNIGNNTFRHLRFTLSHPRDITTLTWSDRGDAIASLAPKTGSEDKIKIRSIFALGVTKNDGTFVPYSEARHLNLMEEANDVRVPNNSVFVDDSGVLKFKDNTGAVKTVTLA